WKPPSRTSLASSSACWLSWPTPSTPTPARRTGGGSWTRFCSLLPTPRPTTEAHRPEHDGGARRDGMTRRRPSGCPGRGPRYRARGLAGWRWPGGAGGNRGGCRGGSGRDDGAPAMGMPRTWDALPGQVAGRLPIAWSGGSNPGGFPGVLKGIRPVAVRAIRGAVQIDANERAAVLDGTTELVTE